MSACRSALIRVRAREWISRAKGYWRGTRRSGPLLYATILVHATSLLASCADDADPQVAPLVTQAPRSLEESPQTQQEKRADWDYRLRKKRDWWGRAREVLFAGIELSSEQARGIEAIIAEQLAIRERLQASDAELQTARATREPARAEAARENSVALRAQLKEPHEIYEELRALLRDEQRPAFDMNRARHAAENRAPAVRRELRAEGSSPATAASP